MESYAPLASLWWAFTLRGVLALLFGIVAVLVPGVTVQFLGLLLGVLILVDGITMIMQACEHEWRSGYWHLLLAQGVIGAGVGIFALAHPEVLAYIIMLVIAIWVLLTGLFEVSTAYRLRHAVPGAWVLGAIGVISVLFAYLIAFFPSASAKVFVALIGAWSFIFGVMLVGIGVQLKRTQVYAAEVSTDGPGIEIDPDESA